MTATRDSSASIDYATWGEEFFTQALTTERVLAGINVLTGQPIDVGPMGVGPGRVVKITATGHIGDATGARICDEPVSFAVEVPVSLDFAIRLALDTQRFTADLVIPLVLTATVRDDLRILIEVDPPAASEVGCDLQAQGLRASFTRYAANLQGGLKNLAASYVRRELDKPYVMEALSIDVLAVIDQAIDNLGPRTLKEDVATDLPEALEAEIRDSERFFPDEADETGEAGEAGGPGETVSGPSATRLASES